MALSDRDFGLLQLSVDVIIERIAALKLNLSVEYDFHALTHFLKSTGSSVINPTFDPHVYPVPVGSFWLRCTDETGVTLPSFNVSLDVLTMLPS